MNLFDVKSYILNCDNKELDEITELIIKRKEKNFRTYHKGLKLRKAKDIVDGCRNISDVKARMTPKDYKTLLEDGLIYEKDKKCIWVG